MIVLHAVAPCWRLDCTNSSCAHLANWCGYFAKIVLTDYVTIRLIVQPGLRAGFGSSRSCLVLAANINVAMNHMRQQVCTLSYGQESVNNETCLAVIVSVQVRAPLQKLTQGHR